jgi:hypothetical protein
MIVRSQFEAVRDEMREANIEEGKIYEIRLPKLMVFKIRKGRIKYLIGKKRYQEIRLDRQKEKYQ